MAAGIWAAALGKAEFNALSPSIGFPVGEAGSDDALVADVGGAVVGLGVDDDDSGGTAVGLLWLSHPTNANAAHTAMAHAAGRRCPRPGMGRRIPIPTPRSKARPTTDFALHSFDVSGWS
jgi:hypothetical protein